MNQARNVLQFTIWYQITEKGKVMEDRYLFKGKRVDNGEWVIGNLIWENDIVECTRGNAIVEWDRVDWKIRWIEESIWRRDLRHWSIDDADGIRFLGNIFDNTELLESEE